MENTPQPTPRPLTQAEFRNKKRQQPRYPGDKQIFLCVPTALLGRKDLTPLDKLLLSTYADYLGPTHLDAWPSAKTLARELGVPYSVVKESQKRLIRLGFIRAGKLHRNEKGVETREYALLDFPPEKQKEHKQGVSGIHTPPRAKIECSETHNSTKRVSGIHTPPCPDSIHPPYMESIHPPRPETGHESDLHVNHTDINHTDNQTKVEAAEPPTFLAAPYNLPNGREHGEQSVCLPDGSNSCQKDVSTSTDSSTHVYQPSGNQTDIMAADNHQDTAAPSTPTITKKDSATKTKSKAELTNEAKDWFTASADNMELFIRFGAAAYGKTPDECIAAKLPSTDTDWLAFNSADPDYPYDPQWTPDHLMGYFWQGVCRWRSQNGVMLEFPQQAKLAANIKSLCSGMTVQQAYVYIFFLIHHFPLIRFLIGGQMGEGIILNAGSLTHPTIRDKVLMLRDRGDQWRQEQYERFGDFLSRREDRMGYLPPQPRNSTTSTTTTEHEQDNEEQTTVPPPEPSETPPAASAAVTTAETSPTTAEAVTMLSRQLVASITSQGTPATYPQPHPQQHQLPPWCQNQSATSPTPLQYTPPSDWGQPFTPPTPTDHVGIRDMRIIPRCKA
ncbi:MAG: helix-turn-helix domain-containing protein [Phycisphaerales bacterium]|nr:helix-turn-helix domain-containing protein [Phycisphaerales bacterium]